jgi:Fur family ferric uptake transcriptional regulator
VRQKRKTKQREVIAACFKAEGRPMSAVEAHESALASIPAIGIATVYRSINEFVESGFLMPISIGTAIRYEIAAEHHYHFHCKNCDKVFCIAPCPFSDRELAPNGYRVDSHDLVLHGVCKVCSQNNEKNLLSR